jgi:hypothetical protein
MNNKIIDFMISYANNHRRRRGVATELANGFWIQNQTANLTTPEGRKKQTLNLETVTIIKNGVVVARLSERSSKQFDFTVNDLWVSEIEKAIG